MRGLLPGAGVLEDELPHAPLRRCFRMPQPCADEAVARLQVQVERRCRHLFAALVEQARALPGLVRRLVVGEARSEEHTSELQSLMRISYAVFCLKKKKK